MSQRRLPWLVAVPLIVGGSFSAHGLSYRIVAPDPASRAELLHDTGHGYLTHVPQILALLLALLLVGIGLRVLTAARGAVGARLSAGLFFLLPLLGFTLQEHLERALHDGSFPLLAALEPTFLVGLLLQLPFALAAYVVAWALLDVADRVGASLRPASRPRWPVRMAGLRPPTQLSLPRISAVALGYPQRGPPPPSR